MDLEKENQVKTIGEEIIDGQINGVEFSFDGKMVAFATGSKIDFFATDSGKRLWSVTGFPQYVASLAISKDGTRCVAGIGDGTVSLIDLKTGKIQHSFKPHTIRIRAIGFTQDDQRIFTGSDDYSLAVFNSKDGKEIWRERGPAVVCCAMTADGKSVFTGSLHHGVMLWDLETGKPRVLKRNELGTARPIGFFEDQVLTRGVDTTTQINFWNPKMVSKIGNFPLESGWEPRDGPFEDHLLVRHYSGSLGIFNLKNGKMTPLINSTGAFNHWYSKEKNFIFGFFNGSIKKWNVKTGKESPISDDLEKIAKFMKECNHQFRFEPNSQKAVRFMRFEKQRGLDYPIGNLEFIDFATDKKVSIESFSTITPFAISDDGAIVLAGRYVNPFSGKEYELVLWDHKTGKTIRNFKGFPNPVTNALITPDRGHIIAISEDSILRIFDAATGEIKDQLDFQNFCDSPATVHLSKDSKKMLIGTKRGLSLYFERR